MFSGVCVLFNSQLKRISLFSDVKTFNHNSSCLGRQFNIILPFPEIRNTIYFDISSKIKTTFIEFLYYQANYCSYTNTTNMPTNHIIWFISYLQLFFLFNVYFILTLISFLICHNSYLQHFHRLSTFFCFIFPIVLTFKSLNWNENH